MTAVRPDLDAARVDAADARIVRRRRVLGIVLVVALLLGAAAVVEWARGARAGARAAARLVGTWTLVGVDRADAPVVTGADLTGYAVTLQFDGGGTATVGTGCATTAGHYGVRWQHVLFSDTYGPAVACGYTTVEAERTGTAVGVAVNAVVEHGADVAFPAAGRLTLTVGDDVLRYTR